MISGQKGMVRLSNGWGHIMKDFGYHGKKSRLQPASGKEAKKYF